MQLVQKPFSLTEAQFRKIDRAVTAIAVFFCLAVLFATFAHAGTDGTEWQPLYNKVLGMLQGWGGKFIAIASFGWGLFSVFGRGSLQSAFVGFGVGIAVFVVPGLLDSFFTALI